MDANDINLIKDIPAITTVEECNELHARNMSRAVETVRDGIIIGEFLERKKAELKHGEFLSWFQEQVKFSRQTGDNYRKLYKHRSKLLSVSNLADAYRLLSDTGKPSTPESKPQHKSRSCPGVLVRDVEAPDDEYDLHPIPEHIGLAIDSKLLQDLAKSIKAHGQMEPIVLHEGKILDGWLRYLACKMIEAQPRYIEYYGNDAVGFWKSENLFRAHGLDGYRKAIEVAKALAEIRDRKLYRGSHDSFASYVKDKWNLDASSVNEMIEVILANEVSPQWPHQKPSRKTRKPRCYSRPPLGKTNQPTQPNADRNSK